MTTDRTPVRWLRQGNRDLRRTGVWVWSLPALHTTLPNGDRFTTCPEAGVCAVGCYARYGTYRFRNVRAAHLRNLMATFDLDAWTADVIAQVTSARFDGAWVRIHDAGDFYSEPYARAWCDIARAAPPVSFYAYTKEVALWKRLHARALVPTNLTIIYSLGGKQDHLVDRDVDRHCDVFPTLDALLAAGYHDQAADDRLAVTGPRRVGIVANRLPVPRRLADGRAFSEWQDERDARVTGSGVDSP